MCDQRAGTSPSKLMNSPLSTLRGATAALTAACVLTGAAPAAPKKTEPAAVVEPAPAPEKKSLFSRAKEKIGLKKKEPPAPPPATKAAETAKQKPAAEGKPAPRTAAIPKAAPAPKAKPVPPAKPAKPDTAVAAAPPEKKGWLKGIFRKAKDEPSGSAEPSLAKAKTAKPSPVKEVKPAKPDETVAAADAPKEKRGMFGFLRRLREPVEDESAPGIAEADKIERPDNWQEHKVVTDNGVALYTFGPSQFNGPDQRLHTGAVVKVKSIKRGYALVSVDGGITGYMDASLLRDAEKTDFREPAPPEMASLTNPDYWAPLAPPPDLPDQPSAMDADAALLLLPPLEPKPNP